MAASPRTCVIWVAQYIPDHKALTCESYNRVKSRVSNEQTKAEIKSNFLHLKICLAQDYGISSAFLGAYRKRFSDEDIPPIEPELAKTVNDIWGQQRDPKKVKIMGKYPRPENIDTH